MSEFYDRILVDLAIEEFEKEIEWTRDNIGMITRDMLKKLKGSLLD
jgi:cytoplasmic iron level regulating protein YaaA (DUF328/UPF0246 family)